MKPLLVLVDLQQDYLKSPQLDPAAGSVVDGAAALLAHARAEAVPVAHVWTTVTRDPDNRMAHWKRAGLWQCEAGNRRPCAAACARPAPRRARSSTNPASARPISPPSSTGLGRDTVIVAGVKTHACVRQLALDAWQAGLTVIIAADAVGSDDPLHAAATRRYFKARGIEFLSNGELNELFGRDATKPCGTSHPRAWSRPSPPLPPHRGHGAIARWPSAPSCCAASLSCSRKKSSPSPR